MWNPTPLEAARFVNGYGQDWRQGVLVDHVARAAELPQVRHVVGLHAEWVVDDADGGRAWPVVCGDLVWIYTEDGRMDGRCGANVVPGRHACEGHADDRDAYLAMSEAERAYREREEDRLYG